MQWPEDILEQTSNLIHGISVTTVTLVGIVQKSYPYKHGNCFSMLADNGREYKVVNFFYENLKEGIRRNKLTLPVRLYVLGDAATSTTAILYDTRIPGDWYNSEFCTTCTPHKLLPFGQRAIKELKIESGAIIVTDKFTIERMNTEINDWRTEEEKQPIVYMSYRTSEPAIYDITNKNP